MGEIQNLSRQEANEKIKQLAEKKERAKELWSAVAKTWFSEGVDDPELTLIKVIPEHGYYWDTKDGKVVSLLKMVVGAISGNKLVAPVFNTFVNFLKFRSTLNGAH